MRTLSCSEFPGRSAISLALLDLSSNSYPTIRLQSPLSENGCEIWGQLCAFLAGGAPSTGRSCTAQVALATAAEVIPGVDPSLVAVIPVKADGVAADGRNRLGPCRCFVQLQQRGRLRLLLAWLAAGCSALLMAGGARAGVAQPGEVPAALVAVFPVDLHAGAGRLLHPDTGRLGRLAGQIGTRGLLRPPPRRPFLADKSDAFVAHHNPRFKNTASRRSTQPFPNRSAPPASACAGDACGARNGLPDNRRARRRSSSASSTSRESASPQ